MIFRRSKPTKNSFVNAEKILNNELFVHSAWPAIKIDKKLTWAENPFNDITWCYYFHSLDIVGYLMIAYEMDPKQSYLEKAKYFIESWINTNPPVGKQASQYAWKDHSVANRVVNLIFFWEYYKESNFYDVSFSELLMKSLKEHGDFLEDDINHTFINNHGIFQDRSLIELAVLFPGFLKSDKWYNKAINRLLSHLKKDVSSNGIHLEHSASYHIVVFNLIQSINDFLAYHGKDVAALSEIVIKMEDYLVYLIKPDGTIPMTGDSGPTGLSKESKINNLKLLFNQTKGKNGLEPENDIVYQHEGIAIFRNGWDFDQQIYLKFIAAFHSRVHKHADDLSFLLSIGRTDFFVDSGKYNYQEKDPIRQYLRSSLAHNTITVNRKSYEIEDAQIGKAKINNYAYNHYYSYVSGSHTLYPGVIIKRSILYLKESGSILIFDQIKSSKLRTYSQIFNIGKDINVTQVSKKKILFESTLDNSTIELLQVNEVTEFKNYKGKNVPIAGWQSTVFNKKHPIPHLQFSNKGTDLDYRTIINTDIDSGIKYYSVKNELDGDIFTVTFKNGAREMISIKK